MGRKKKLPLLENVVIEDLAAEGKSLARIENMVLFVKNLVPGDVADIQVIRKRKKYMEGIPVNIKQESPHRIKPVCVHFGTCGGCKWQQLPYEKQLEYKQKQVRDNFERIGKVYTSVIKPIIPSEETYYYRNKLEYTFSRDRWLSQDEISSGEKIEDKNALGYYIPGRFNRVLHITECHLQAEMSNTIRNEIYAFAMQHKFTFYSNVSHTGFLRNLIIRNTSLNEWMVVLSFAENNKAKIHLLLDHVRKSFPGITSLYFVINEKRNDTIHDLELKLYEGKAFIEEKLDTLTFNIGPKSFFQTNSRQALKLYQRVKELAQIGTKDVVYDLYTGTGTIAQFIANGCQKVVGIEYIDEAIKDARTNSQKNNITNAAFFTGDIRETLTREFFRQNGKPDTIITDPPRAGMHKDVVKAIMDTGARKIVYVSCNPATQARDIHLLSEKYDVEILQPIDMFPQTHHVENIALLIRK